jgi:hypothetical protein
MAASADRREELIDAGRKPERAAANETFEGLD